MSDSQKEMFKGFTLDPELVADLDKIPREDPLIVEYGNMGKNGEDKTRFVEKWFPGESEWKGKTIVSHEQARAIALMNNITKMFDEIEDLQPFISAVIEDYEMLLTSVDGISREQHAGIMRSMFGGPTESEETARTAFMSMLAGRDNEDDD